MSNIIGKRVKIVKYPDDGSSVKVGMTGVIHDVRSGFFPVYVRIDQPLPYYTGKGCVFKADELRYMNNKEVKL